MAIEVLSAPAKPLLCCPGEELQLCWTLRTSVALPAAQLRLRQGREGLKAKIQQAKALGQEVVQLQSEINAVKTQQLDGMDTVKVAAIEQLKVGYRQNLTELRDVKNEVEALQHMVEHPQVVSEIEEVPAGCVELVVQLYAPSVEASCVGDFVFVSGDISADLQVVLDVRSGERRVAAPLCDLRGAAAHPELGIIPGNHTRRIYFGKLEQAASASPPILAPEVITERCWTLVEQTGFSQASLKFMVNGEEHEVSSGQFPLTMNLAEYLRYHLGLTGTKIGCGEGGCGACTVLLKSPGAKPQLANACLRPLHAMDGIEVTTIERLGSPEKPHAIQQAFVSHSASQCGMCTPGMVMAIYGHLAKGGSKEAKELQGCIQGNLCRCTGYRPIHDAMLDAAAQAELRPGVEVLERPPRALAMQRNGQMWFDCTDLGSVFELLQQHSALPHRLVVGNTSTGVIKYYPFHPSDDPRVFINLTKVPELRAVKCDDQQLTVGAACTLSVLIEELEAACSKAPQLKAVVKHLQLVAHPQVRDVASWAGNVMIAKTHPDFPSDVCLLLSTLKAQLTLMDASRKTQVMDVISFLTSEMPAGRIIYSVTIPFPGSESFLDSFKVMRRHMNTHAELNAGFLFNFKNGLEIADARLVLGNIAHQPFLAVKTREALLGRRLDGETIAHASKILSQEVQANLKGPSVSNPPFVVVPSEYRVRLAPQLFAKAALRAAAARGAVLSAAQRSAVVVPPRPASSGHQSFKVDPSTAPVGQPITKFQGLHQACGTAEFVADAALRPRTLFAVPVLAQRVALLKRIDASECLEVTGVHSIISAADVKDVGATNDLGTVYPGKIFADASEKTQHLGQFICLVLAESFEAARMGAGLVTAEYEGDEEVVTTIEQAVQKGAVQERHGLLSIGQRQSGPESLQGKIVSFGQKHFYLETQTTYAYQEDSGLVFNTSCQTLDWAQSQMAQTLNLPKSRITVQNQRLGGAYGGKAMLFAPCCGACGVAVLKTQRPVLLQIDRSLDFQAFGARCPFDASWDLSHEENGKIVSMKQEVLQNVGTDMKGFSQASSMNCYDIPHAQLHCKGVVTNLPVNTWMRAPGDFEGAFIMEAIMEQVARAVKKDPVEVQELNLASGMEKAWERLKVKVGYAALRKQVDQFNSQSRYRKKGIYCMGSRYQLEPDVFTEKCLLRVYDDGSVLLEHSGLEVGQGIDTKVLQACTMGLRKISADFATERIQLRQPKSTHDFDWKGLTGTFSSTTSETVVSAVLNACTKLEKELHPWKAAGTWSKVIAEASEKGAQLCQEGITDHAAMKKYTLFSAGCAQVEIDILTGETQVDSFDLVYDCGKSINPAVDIGQIEGSLMQALGFSLLEEEARDSRGRLINCGTWDYKVPSGRDIPVRLDVELLPCEDPSAPVLGSKASGEPAQLLGGAFFFAVKDAIGYAREEQGLSREFRLDPPASPDRIQLACNTDLQP